jgi:ureidoacrylate peracid hydrolase
LHSFALSADAYQRILARRGRLHGFERINSRHTALVVVDMQNAFCDGESPLQVPVAREIVPNINKLAHTTRLGGGMVIWVRMTVAHRDEWPLVFDELLSPEVGGYLLEGLKPGSHGHNLWAEMETKSSDMHISKNRYSAFLPTSSDIAVRLRQKDVDTVIIVGTITNVCCESSARDAAMMDFKTIMVSDASAALTDEAHAAALANFIHTFGDVRTTDEMIALLHTTR